MQLLTQFIAPVVSLWVIHNAIFSSARFVNKMRETVISGIYEGQPISSKHRTAIFIDWCLCIAATILVCLIFAGIVVAVSQTLSQDRLSECVGLAIAAYPLACAIGFATCSYFDGRLMWKARNDKVGSWP